MGTNTLRYTQNGIQVFRSDGNITIGIPRLSIVGTPVTLSPATFKNSSHIEYHYVTTVTIALVTYGIDIIFFIKNSSNPYDRSIRISGTVTGLVGTGVLQIPLSNPNSLIPSNCDTNNSPNVCTSVQFGSMGFDWSDMPSATYDNSTLVVSSPITSSFLFDPIAVDGSANCTGTTTCNAALSTTNANDVLIAGISVTNAGTGVSCSTVTSSPALTWTQRQTGVINTATTQTCYYYTVWTSSGSITITCANSGGGAPQESCHTFGISSASIGTCGSGGATCFDTNANAKCTATGSGTSLTCNVTTSNANDMIIGILGQSGVGTSVTASTGFTLIGTCAINGANNNQNCSDRDIVSTTQTNLATGFSWTGSFPSRVYGDAIIQKPVTNFDHTVSVTEVLSPTLKQDITSKPSVVETLTATLSQAITSTLSTTVSLVATLNQAITSLLSATITLVADINAIQATIVVQQALPLLIGAIIVAFAFIGILLPGRRRRR